MTVVFLACAAKIGRATVDVLHGSGIVVSPNPVSVKSVLPYFTAPVQSPVWLQEPLPPGLVLAGRKVEAKKSKFPIVFLASRPGAKAEVPVAPQEVLVVATAVGLAWKVLTRVAVVPS